MAAGIWHKIQVFTNLSILIWISVLNTFTRWIRSSLLNLLGHIAPSVRAETGLLVNTYEFMRERLRDSLKELEDKTHQLEKSEAQLRTSRDFLQSIIDSLDDDLMVLDGQLHVVQANRSLCLKHKDSQVVGRYCYEVTHGASHPCRPPDCVCPVTMVLQTGMPARVIHQHSPDHIAGADKYIEVSASPIRDGGGKIALVAELVRDVTESKELEKGILEANKRLRALNAIAGTVSQSLSLDLILNSALEKALELTRAQVGAILLLDNATQTLHYRVYHGLSRRFIQGTSGLPLGEGIAGKAADLGETLVADDVSTDPRVSHRTLLVEEGLKAFVSVPLMSKEKVVGVLNIITRETHVFPEQEVQLLTAMGHQLGIAIENAQLYEQLKLKDDMRAELLRQIISAQEDERQRVARELHDVTSQVLATLTVRLEALSTALGANGSEMKSQFEEMKSLLADTSREVHRLIHDLRPTLLDDVGLAAALRSCAHSTLDAAGIEVHLEVEGQEKKLPSQVGIALFRIVQEAITNIASHARAESAYISLEFKDASIAVQVEDDGVGFDLAQVFSPSCSCRGSVCSCDSVGLMGMKERAELLGGTFTIDTEPGRGTRLAVEIPVEWEESDVQDNGVAS